MSGYDGGGRPAESTVDIHALRCGRAVMELSLDAVFTVLSTRRRRVLLRILADADVCHLDQVAGWVAARERQLDGEEPDRESIHEDLEEVHLPMLERYCIVDYDTREGSIRYYGHPVVEEYLEHSTDFE